jgi:hypothetical protein
LLQRLRKRSRLPSRATSEYQARSISDDNRHRFDERISPFRSHVSTRQTSQRASGELLAQNDGNLAPRLHPSPTVDSGVERFRMRTPKSRASLSGASIAQGESQMFRKILFALAAIVALGAAGMASTAEAGHGHRHGCGYYGGHGHGHYDRHYGGYRGYGYGSPYVRSSYGSPYYGGYGYGRYGYGGYPNYYRGYGSGVSFSIGF